MTPYATAIAHGACTTSSSCDPTPQTAARLIENRAAVCCFSRFNRGPSGAAKVRGMSDTSNPPVGVRSEVGRLRTVMLHRPGNELRRLTPRNNDALLFDGLPWVDRAQQEHDGFADALRGRGVEVLYLSKLLNETLDDEAARRKAIGETVTDIRLGDTLRRYLSSHPVRSRARRPGRGPDGRAAQRRDRPHRQHGRRVARAGRLPHRSAAQPALHPRLQCLGRRSSDHHLAGHAGPAPGDPADRVDLRVPPALRRRAADPRLGEGIPRGRRRARARRRRARGRRR